MRFLAANRPEFSRLKPAAKITGPIAIVAKIDKQFCGDLRRLELALARAHHLQNCGTDESQERHERGDRVPRQTKHRAFTDAAEEKWFARLDGHAPDVDLGAERAQRGLNQIVFTDRHAAVYDQNVIFDARPKSLAQRIVIIAAALNR